MTPAVTVFTLGGTISAVKGGDERLTGAQVLAGVPAMADVELHDFRRLPSSSLSIDDVAALAVHIEEAGRNGSGSVVVQGTDTLEETAFLLDLLCPPGAPVAVNGAMRRPDATGADGPANLAAAIAVAADPGCRGLGVVTVLADEIHAARYVRKAHTTSRTAPRQNRPGVPRAGLSTAGPLPHAPNLPTVRRSEAKAPANHRHRCI